MAGTCRILAQVYGVGHVGSGWDMSHAIPISRLRTSLLPDCVGSGWDIIPGGGGTSILKVTGTCRWTGYDFAVINISTGYLVALLRSSILAQGI